MKRILGIAILAISTGCLTPGGDQTTFDQDTTPTIAPGRIAAAGGARAAKIVFRATSPIGSFSSSGATKNEPGRGAPAVRIFSPDGTIISSTGPGEGELAWLNRVEIGISGSINTAATDADCARFATATDEAAVCDFNLDATADIPCGAPSGFYRVSEYDCNQGTLSTGTGGPGDGVYIRVEIERNHLSSHENLMFVLEYAASGLSAPTQDPVACFTDGSFDPKKTGCADMLWQVFLKPTATATVQPFFTLIPPVFSHIDTTNNRSGTGVETKKIYIPLASNRDLRWIQISRISSLSANTTNFSTACTDNSAHCVGVVFHALTIYRI